MYLQHKEKTVDIYGDICINHLIYKKFKLVGNDFDDWSLFMDSRHIFRMPGFQFDELEKVFNWMTEYVRR